MADDTDLRREEAKVKSAEAEKQFLLDKSVPGPRPTDAFIEENLGRRLSLEEMAKVAKERASRAQASEMEVVVPTSVERAQRVNKTHASKDTEHDL